MVKLLIGDSMEISEIINAYKEYQNKLLEFWRLL